ncbi:MAG: hypothetical protein SGARI_007742 [Bacillariaceae sp.]
MDVTDSLAQIIVGTSTKQMASHSSEDEAEFSDHSSRQVNKKTKLNDKRSNDKNKDYQPSSYRKRSPAIEDDSDDDDSVLDYVAFARKDRNAEGIPRNP